MCLIECHVCRCNLMSLDAPSSPKYGHKCCQSCEHAYPFFEAIEKERDGHNRNSNSYRHAIEEVLGEASEQMLSGAKTVTLPRELVEKLANTINASDHLWSVLLSRLRVAADAAKFCRTGAASDAAQLKESSKAHGRALENWNTERMSQRSEAPA